MTEIVVVPLERHVERAMQGGARAIAWPRLVDALAQRWLEGVRFAGPEHTRLALADAAPALAHGPMRRARSLGALSWEHMLDALDDAILELRRADVDAAQLRALARSRATLAPRATLLADALEALDARLAKSGLVDGRALESRLARALAEVDAAVLVEALGAPRLVARAFVSFDAQTAAVLRAIARALEPVGGDVRVELASFATPLDALRERDPLEILIDRAGALLGEPPETFAVSRRLGDFTGDAPPTEPERVAIAICESAEAQARAAILSVLRALAQGTPVESVAIVSPTGDEETLTPLRRLADEAGIPLYDARGPAPARAGIVAFALEALTVGGRGLPRRDVARLLRSTYIDGRGLAGERPRAKLAAIASALEGTPTLPRATARESLLHTVRLGLAERFENDEREELAAISARIADALEASAGARTRLEHVAAARALFERLGLRVRAEGLAKGVLGTDQVPTGVARAELRALAADSHAWEVLQNALVRYETAAIELALDAPCAAEIFEHELRRALEAGPPLPGGGRAFAVRVGRLNELAFEPLAHVVVLDANDGVLPRLDAEEGLVSAELTSALRERDVRRAPHGEGERGAAQLAALATLASGASSVLVTHRTEDDSGAMLAESAFVLWLQRAGVKATRVSDAPLALEPVSPREHELLLLALAPDYAQRHPSAQRRAAREVSRERWHDRIDGDPDAAATEEVGLLGADVALVMEQETGGGARPMSVTALERIATCPFQGFASAVLRAGEELAPEDRPDAREEGTMVHEALRVVFEGTRELLRKRPRDAGAIATRARALLDEHFAVEAAPLRELAVARLREEVQRVLDVAVADEAWDFDGAEVAFGAPGVGDAYAFEEDGTKLALRGTIDRVDVARDAAAVRVIDYKRAVRHAVKRDELGTTRLQIPVYAAQASAARGLTRAEGAYLPTQTPEVQPSPDFTARLGELLDAGGAELRRSLLRAVAPLRHGEVAPRPASAAACARCDLDGGCRRPRFVSGDAEATEDP